MEKNRYLYIRLYPEPSRVSKEQPPIASFVLRVSIAGANRKPYISPGLFIYRLLLCLDGWMSIQLEGTEFSIKQRSS